MKSTRQLVVQKALRDEKFLNALIKNTDKVLKGFEMTDAEKKKLKSLMQRKYTIKGTKLLKIIFHYLSAKTSSKLPPPPAWPGMIYQPTIKDRSGKK
jgi:hypothetical protein